MWPNENAAMVQYTTHILNGRQSTQIKQQTEWI